MTDELFDRNWIQIVCLLESFEWPKGDQWDRYEHDARWKFVIESRSWA